MIERKIKNVIYSRLKNYPAVAILGPRQVGKTTLAKTLSPIYFDLELEEEKLRLDLQWNDIVNSERLIILDEAQNYPEIFPRIRNAIDKDRKRNGRFLILGSVSPGLMIEVSELLTGRIAICELAPFSIDELDTEIQDDLWLLGGYPDGGVLQKDNFPVWQQNYLDLLAMRDLPLWGLPAKPQVTKRFFKMLAAIHGKLWNASQLGKSLGLSYHTVDSYLDFLEQSYLIRKIPPFFTNLKKRLVKSSKVYWRDSGLLHSLLNINTMEGLIEQPWVGFSWEGWIIEQIIIFLNNHNINYDGPYFLKINSSCELDLVLIISGNIWGIEIKLTSSPGKQDLEKLNKAANLISVDKKALISRTENSITGTDIISANLNDFLNIIAN